MIFLFFYIMEDIRVSKETMIEVLSMADVVFIGEKHDNEFDHKVELDLLKELSKRKKVILSLEMFERDVQNILDDYLSGKITEKEFLQNSRPWPNYRTDYRPLIKYAKEKNIPVIASNIPRRIANMIAHGKEIKDSIYLPDTVFFDDEDYRKRFYETMKSMGHVKGDEMVERFYKAQCYKDAVMAESILSYMEKYPDYLIISINGNFHSDFHSGIPYQLLKRNKDLKIKVVTMKDKMVEGAGDIIIIRGEK